MESVVKKISNSCVVQRYHDLAAVYTFAFVVYLAISRSSLYCVHPIFHTAVSYGFAMVGIILLLIDFAFRRTLLKIPCGRLIAVFLCAMVISSILNIEYGWVDNAKTIVWTTIQVAIIVPVFFIADKSRVSNLLLISFKLLSVLFFVAAAVSVLQAMLQIGYVAEIGSAGSERQGFYDGRLFGVFFDPNNGASDCLVMILLSAYCLKKSILSRGWRIYLIISVLVELIYVALAASRTAFLAFAVVSILYVFISFYQRDKNRKHFVARSLLVCWLTIVLASVLFPHYASFAAEHIQPFFCTETDISEMHAISRNDVDIDNISNNRFAIWADYLVASENDLFFGKSPRNYLDIIEQQYPDLYIVAHFDNAVYQTHNGYLTVLVSMGLVGVLLFLLIVFTWLKRLVCYVKDFRFHLDDEFYLALGVFLLVAIKIAFFSIVFFTYCFDSVVFWLSFGYLLYRFEQDALPDVGFAEEE